MRDLQFWRGVVRVCQQLVELRLIHRVEGLISGNNPLYQQVFELVLIPRTLKNINALKIWTQIRVVDLHQQKFQK
jgi:hypothetical protein